MHYNTSPYMQDPNNLHPQHVHQHSHDGSLMTTVDTLASYQESPYQDNGLEMMMMHQYPHDPSYSPGNSSNASNANKGKAKRVSKACDHCVKRKIKCTGEQPCASCSRLKYECLYTLPRSRKGRLSNTEKQRRDSLISQNNLSGLELLSAGDAHSRKLSQASIETLDPMSSRSSANWTHDTFTCLVFMDLDGNAVTFIDLFFRLVHPRFPVLAQTWVMNNIYEMPLGLLHAMYSICVCVAKSSGYRSFHNHNDHKELYNTTVSFLAAAIVSPSPMDVLYVALLSFLEMWSQNVNAAASYMGLASRLAQTIGIEKDQEIVWVSPTGRVLGNDAFTGRALCRALYMMLYIQDFYMSNTARIPCMIHQEINTQLMIQQGQAGLFPDDVIAYRVYILPLLTIARKIKLETEANTMNDKVRAVLDAELVNWHDNLSKVMPMALNPDSPATKDWIMYMNLVYHGLQLQLHAQPFLTAVSAGNKSDPIIIKLTFHKQQIQDILNENLTDFSVFLNIPFYFLHAVFYSAIYECALEEFSGLNGPSISAQIQIYTSIQYFFPLVAQQGEMLKTLQANPSLAMNMLSSAAL